MKMRDFSWLTVQFCRAVQSGLLWCVAGLVVLSGPAQADSADTFFAHSLRDLDGKSVSLSQYRGKPLVVNFWARWCPPCKAEIPALIQFAARTRPEGLVVLGLALEDDVPGVARFAREAAMNYPVLLLSPQDARVMAALGNTRGGLPFTVAINREGQIVRQKMGLMHEQDLAAFAEASLATRAAKKP